MNEPRPLHEVFGERAHQLAEDRHAALDEAGHPGLPDELLAEAVVSYADTAPAPVAEHLSPFVTAHTAERFGEPGGAGADLSHGLELLASAPAVTGTDLEDVDLSGPVPDAPAAPGQPDPAVDGLDFGGGAGNGDTLAPGPEAAAPEPQPPAGEVAPSPPANGGPGADEFAAPVDDPFFDAVPGPVAGQTAEDGDPVDGGDLPGI